MTKSGYKICKRVHKKHGRWNERKETWVKNHYLEFSITEIAEKLHLCPLTVRNHMKRIGIKIDRRKPVGQHKNCVVCVTISPEAYGFISRYANKSRFIDNILCQLSRKYGDAKTDGYDEQFDE